LTRCHLVSPTCSQQCIYRPSTSKIVVLKIPLCECHYSVAPALTYADMYLVNRICYSWTHYSLVNSHQFVVYVNLSIIWKHWETPVQCYSQKRIKEIWVVTKLIFFSNAGQKKQSRDSKCYYSPMNIEKCYV